MSLHYYSSVVNAFTCVDCCAAKECHLTILSTIFHAIIVSRILHALPAWGVFMSVAAVW